MNHKPFKIAIFASGSGSNAENIVNHFRDRQKATVELIVSNNPNAFVLERAKKHDINTICIDRESFRNAEELIGILKDAEIDLIVLAGFLWLIPEKIIEAYPLKIVNIHPALLPKYGGKGMYGDHVHQAVSGSGDKETGITIHFVDKAYDEGAVIFQEKVEIESGEDPLKIAAKIHTLEYKHFPQVIENLLAKRI